MSILFEAVANALFFLRVSAESHASESNLSRKYALACSTAKYAIISPQRKGEPWLSLSYLISFYTM
jgi:hypothetical protein